MKTNPNQAAFTEGIVGRNNTLTKREYFAAAALAGLCVVTGISEADVAKFAVTIADLLIERLNETAND